MSPRPGGLLQLSPSFRANRWVGFPAETHLDYRVPPVLSKSAKTQASPPYRRGSWRLPMTAACGFLSEEVSFWNLGGYHHTSFLFCKNVVVSACVRGRYRGAGGASGTKTSNEARYNLRLPRMPIKRDALPNTTAGLTSCCNAASSPSSASLCARWCCGCCENEPNDAPPKKRASAAAEAGKWEEGWRGESGRARFPERMGDWDRCRCCWWWLLSASLRSNGPGGVRTAGLRGNGGGRQIRGPAREVATAFRLH